MAHPDLERPVRRRRHRSPVRQLDRRALEQAGWRTTLEFRENHLRLDDGRLVEVESFWVAEAEHNGYVICSSARSESRAWSRLHLEAERVGRLTARENLAAATV